ncbi:MAG TPA: hypothetical protein PKX21_02055 [Candidatus Pacearchaeota archaeon]|nr:hypothetical protein [Candidatus Pacearchaeota archaeon]
MASSKKSKREVPETDIQKVVNHYFYTRGLSLDEIKESARKKKIIYGRYTRAAKEILELAGSVDKARQAITTVAEWAKSRNLEYSLETVAKKWLELDRLKPREVIKKPFYRNMPLVWSNAKGKWYAINDDGEWLEFVGQEEEIEWKVVD